MSSPFSVPGRDRSRRIDLAVTAGGVLVVLGSVLPWLSLFAGLRQYSGWTGLHGWTLAILGVVLAASPRVVPRGTRWVPLVLLLAVSGAGIVMYTAVGLIDLLRDPHYLFMVPRPGPGLPVALVGCVLAGSVAVVSRRHTSRAKQPNSGR